MSERPVHTPRADSRATIGTLVGGTLVAFVLFVASFALRLAGNVDASDAIGAAGVVALLATPALGLVTTAVELKGAARSTWLLAIVVLLILGAATALALVAAH